jgi:hypothetical protein
VLLEIGSIVEDPKADLSIVGGQVDDHRCVGPTVTRRDRHEVPDDLFDVDRIAPNGRRIGDPIAHDRHAR